MFRACVNINTFDNGNGTGPLASTPTQTTHTQQHCYSSYYDYFTHPSCIYYTICMKVANPFNLVENAWSLKNLMLDNKLLMVYSDHITPRTYEHLMNLAEDKLDHYNTSLRNKKKILHILVEALQNIATHGYKDHTHTVASLFVIGMEGENKFFVLSGNTVTKESEAYLREKLDHLNTLDSEQLRTIYKETIQNGEFTDKGGAGLGFIDIMRKSQSKLEYYFTPVTLTHSFFTFKVNVQSEETDKS